MSIPTAKEVTRRALHEAIEVLMVECTVEQNAFLHRINDSAPWKGLANCPDKDLPGMYDLVVRTVVSNRANAA